MEIKTRFNIDDKVYYIGDFPSFKGGKEKQWVETSIYAIQIVYSQIIRYLTDNGWKDEKYLYSREEVFKFQNLYNEDCCEILSKLELEVGEKNHDNK